MSEVLICNRALQLLGDDPIIALTDNSKRARAMNLAYAPVRDAELRRRRWKFSIARAQLPANATAPLSDYANAFPLPTDWLRLIGGADLGSYPDLADFSATRNALYSLEGRQVLTNLPAPLSIRYIRQVTDTSMFDAAFAEALCARLAYECCEQITQSDSKQQLAMARYKQAISEALRANALESATESIADDSWIAARLG